MERFQEPDANEPNKVAAEVDRLILESRALWDQRKLAETEPLLRRALELAENVLDPEHVLVAAALSHLAWLASAREQHDQAVPLYRRALAIRENHLGPTHPDTLHSVEELATALFLADARSEEADALALGAIAAHETAGRDDAELAGLIATLGWRRYWIGRYAEAEPLLLRALAMQERLLGPTDLATAGTAQRLAMMYDHRGFDIDAEPYYRQALEGFEQGGDPLESFEARYRLADYLHRQGRDDDADELFESLIARLIPPDKFQDPDRVHWMLGGCCDYLRRAGRLDDVRTIEEWASAYDAYTSSVRSQAERAELTYGAESLELAEVLGTLALAYSTTGQADEAEESASRALAIQTARLGSEHPSSVAMREQLARIRDQTKEFASHRRVRRLGNSEGQLFNHSTFPWRDERRADLIRAYFAALIEDDEDDENGAQMAIVALTFSAELDEQWEFILELIAEAPDDDEVLSHVAAGPLEGFLGRFDDEVIERVESEAKRDPKFRRVLQDVWQHGMSDAVWTRVCALKAGESESSI